jgi:hypothetical protein
VADVGEGGSGGDGAGKPKRPKRDLNAGRDDVLRLCAHLADRIEANGSPRPDIGKTWLDAARLMIDTENRNEGQIHKAIDWSQDSDFWCGVILSMPNLRKHYNQMRLQARGKPSPNGTRPPRGGASDDLSGEVYGQGRTRI